jgi:hypothetical protein
MTAGRNWLRATVAAVATAALILPAAGCGAKQNNQGAGATTGAGGDGQIGGAPTTVATGDPTGSPTTGSGGSGSGGSGGSGSGSGGSGSGGSGGQPAPTYPAAAKDYALAFLKAAGARNATRVDQLSTSAVAVQIRTTPIPNSTWTYTSCQTAAGISECTFYDANGNVVTVTLNVSQLGHPTAVTGAVLDKLEFPKDRVGYGHAFLNAWRNGNKAAMRAFAALSAINAVTPQTEPVGIQACEVSGGAVTYYGLPAGDAFNVTFTFNASRLGRPGAITGVIKPSRACGS